MDSPWGFLDTPWGFRATSRGLVCISTHAERQARAVLGEFAIGLFEQLGINAERLKEIAAAPDPLAALKRLTGEEVPDVQLDAVDNEGNADGELPQ